MGDHLTVGFDSDEGDYTDYATDAPLPTPSATPYRTPHPSRHHSRHATPSPTPSPYPASSSPPTTNGGRASPLHRINTGHHHHPLHHHDRAFDETISILDPRRFTPTLHANLVAEILSLRRELESKSNLVDTLEQDLHEARDEHGAAAASAVTAQREARDIKRQLARAENDDAVEAVAKERDEAVNAVAELKRQVERLTKSRRSAEEDVERVKKMAEQESEEHEASKRALERRAHIAEGRLKTLLDELAVANSMPPPPLLVQEHTETYHEDATQSEVGQSDATSVQGSVRDSYQGRPASWKMGDDEAERLGIRFSVVAANTGKSLADELNFDEDDEDDEEDPEDYDEEDEDDQTAEFSFTEDNASAFAENVSDSGLNLEVEVERECEMTEYHEMGVQVDFDDTQEQEVQKQEQEEQQQLYKESERQVERLDILGLEIEEKLAELERTYVELDRKTVELDSIYNEVDRAHYRILDLEEQVEKMDEEASEREEVISNLKRDHAEEIKLFEARGKEVEEKWTILQAQEASLAQIESNLQKQSRSLDDQEALIIAASTPITIENNSIERSLDERSQCLDNRQISLNEQEASLAILERKIAEQKSDLDERETCLVKQKTALDEREMSLDEQKTTLNEQEAIYSEREKSIDQQKVALKNQKVEWEKSIDEQKTALNEQKTTIDEKEKSLDEKKAELDEREAELDDREAELDDQVTTIVDRKSNLDRREMNLNERERALEERERDLNDTEIVLGERERRLEEREVLVATTTPVAIDDKEHESSIGVSPIETEAKEREYEANERRKRSRSTGVSLPTPFSPQVATFSTPVYVSCESQTTPSYTSVESQTSPPYVSVEAQASPVYVSVDAQVCPTYVSVDTQVNPAYVSIDAQASPVYVSIETQTSPSYVSVEAQTCSSYVSAEAQTSSSYVSTEAQTSSSYVSVETQCISSLYVSTDSQTTSPYVSAESQITPLYISIESQTDEQAPPPIPPRRASPQIPPAAQTQTIGIQTDPMRPPPIARIIPTIAVIPPPPTPPLPPPIMKNATVQTRSKPRVRSRSMQTEEIRLDERIMKLAPHLHPSAIMANHPLPSAPNSTHPARSDAPPPSPPKKSLRRSIVKRTSAMGPTSVPASGSAPRSVPITGDSSGSAFTYNSPPRADTFGDAPEKDKESVRRHLFNGVDFHDVPQSSGDEFLDDADLSANEFKTALSAPKPKKPRNTPHVNLNKPSPAETTFQRPAGGLQRKGATIRKTALISSSSQAHNRARSPSFESTRTSENSSTKIGPPFPVPTRHSSRKPGGYGSHPRNESPTPMSTTFPKRTTQAKHTRQQSGQSVQSVQSIRKVRSATALPNLRTSNVRNRSPPPLSASSAAPDSPSLPFHRDEMRSTFDRPKFGSIKHKHAESTNTSNSMTTAGNASLGSTIQQTSVVDAIAQTMVGEWMWKYVRRRRSFGVTESPQNWDGRDESGGGQRHKRWVWLAPYERAVMWSSRQPTSGNALLGKSGRKLPIQSVLDVKDDTPLPKGADPTKPLFNRSILILTPARALKFTAPSKERHYVWLTALSFLSHSPQGSEGLLALPPPMPFEYEQVQHQQPVAPPRPPVPPIPMHREVPFHPVRDSIRLAKGKSRQSRQKAQKVNGFPPRNDSIREVESIRSAGSVAEPPSIPRFPGQHTRKRSSSAVRPGTQRSISNGYDPSVLSSYGGSNNGDYYAGPVMGVGGIGIVSGGSSMLSGHPGAPLGGWDTGPVGTVRMEAFVERPTRYEFDEEDEYYGPSSYKLRRERRSSRQESHWSGSGDFYAGSGPVEDEGFWRGEDPFGEF